MTTRQLKDSNWASARKSIISKYNKNGDGNFDQSEVDGIIDDYMGTIYNHQSLQGANKSQRKLIIFGAIMIVLLTFSNLGTGIAAANISKEIKIIDGKMTAADNGGSIQTETSLRRFDVPGVVRKEIASARRGLQSDVLCSTQPPENFCDCEDDCTNEPEWCSCDEAQTCCDANVVGSDHETAGTLVACISIDLMKDVVEVVAGQGHASLVVKDEEGAKTTYALRGNMVQNEKGKIIAEADFTEIKIKLISDDRSCEDKTFHVGVRDYNEL